MSEPIEFTAVLMNGSHGSTVPQTFPLPPHGNVPDPLFVSNADGTTSEYRRTGGFDGTAWPYELVAVYPKAL